MDTPDAALYLVWLLAGGLGVVTYVLFRLFL